MYIEFELLGRLNESRTKQSEQSWNIVTTQSDTALLTRFFRNDIDMPIGNFPFCIMHLNIVSYQFLQVSFLIFKKLCRFPCHCCTAVSLTRTPLKGSHISPVPSWSKRS